VMKAIGAGLVMVSSTGLGFRIARDFRERTRQLRALILSVRMLQSEIEYSVTPLPQALRRIAARSQAPLDQLFEVSAQALQDNDITVMVAFQAGIAACEARSALQVQDFEIMTEFGKTLGTSDRIHQSQHFEVTLSRLDGLEHEARESQRQHERMWQYIGVLTGLLLVVLLY
jgi:stage III sporulation protein AB